MQHCSWIYTGRYLIRELNILENIQSLITLLLEMSDLLQSLNIH